MLVPPVAAADTSMTAMHALVLGVVQGVTELLPVSSSAHLFIVPKLLGWTYQGGAFDVALHGGTLVALILAFARDWLVLLRDAFSPRGDVAREARQTWAKLVVATIPGAIAGKLLDERMDALRILWLQACTLAIFGLLLWLVDRRAGRGRDEDSPGWGASIGMGLAQCLALVPGVSRSGITMTAARAAGLSRVSAARFSFMLATPITAGALVLKLKDLHGVTHTNLAIGVASAAIVGTVVIQLLLELLRRTGFGVFFVYRVAVAAFALVFWFGHRG
ncbi:MAG TPA: undecaprenyl-diphosphate phosphatase [Candidatus Acidoferrales bacterium]|nr:undecaprenyl-diphosphate phosphatase [Candidatus Acidoferrales bacterium]